MSHVLISNISTNSFSLWTLSEVIDFINIVKISCIFFMHSFNYKFELSKLLEFRFQILDPTSNIANVKEYSKEFNSRI